MPQYGLMCRSLRDTAFFTQYVSRRTRSSVDEYGRVSKRIVGYACVERDLGCREASLGQSTRCIGRRTRPGNG
eukprot:5962360-Pleurochrysis_carterae.AAC.1